MLRMFRRVFFSINDSYCRAVIVPYTSAHIPQNDAVSKLSCACDLELTSRTLISFITRTRHSYNSSVYCVPTSSFINDVLNRV